MAVDEHHALTAPSLVIGEPHLAHASITPMPDQTGNPAPRDGQGEVPGLDTRHAHSARVYNYWLGGTMRDRAAITRFFDGLDLLDPGVVQPQQWRPESGAASPPQVTAWCGVARKP